MRDGYYLSTYLEIGSLANLYNYGQRHDHNVSLWHKSGNDIKLIHYWELERESGNKYHRIACFDIDDAKRVINELLKIYNLTLDDMVEVWGTPGLQTCEDYHSIDDYPEFAYHGVAHLFSAILMDTDIFYNSNIVGLGVDGGPDTVLDVNAYEKSFYAGCVVQNGNMDMFPAYSPGVIWELASNHFGLREGTLMALATASSSKAYFEQEDVILYNGNKDGAFVQLKNYVKHLIERVDQLTEKDAGRLFNHFDPLFSIEENKISMVMKEIQNMSFRIMERNIDMILDKYNIDAKDAYLALGGGYILNCPSNSHLMKKYKFKGFIAPPCVSDTGMSLGIALYAFRKKMGRFNFKFEYAFYGDKDDSLNEIIRRGEFKEFIKSVSDFDLEKVVEDIKEAPIVWFSGAAEIGPRALGNRSIIGDPRSNTVKDELNRIKQRQWWRPVAPIVLEDDMEEWFENTYPSPYMLHTFKIRDDRKELIPAVSHLDESARVQTADPQTNPEIYKLIKAFKEDTGVPIICNTSLNDKGEPIINRIEEALNFALRKEIKVAYINGKRVELQSHDKYTMDTHMPRPLMVGKIGEDAEALKKELNPHNISKDVLYYYFNMHRVHQMYDLKNKRDAREVSIWAKTEFKKIGLDYIPWG